MTARRPSRVLRRVDLPGDVFGEGLACVSSRLVQLTSRSGRGFVYDLGTLRLLHELRYEGEDWGLAYDGARIQSDGTNVLIVAAAIRTCTGDGEP